MGNGKAPEVVEYDGHDRKICRALSEIVTQGALHDPRGGDLAAEFSECRWRVEIRRQAAEGRVVEHIVDLPTEVQRLTLLDLKPLHQRKIAVVIGRPAE